MTRKRFIKLLMWAGMSRNDAAICAEMARNAGRPYFKVLGDLLNWHRPQFKNMRPAWLQVWYTIAHGRHTWPGMATTPAKVTISIESNISEYVERLQSVVQNVRELSRALGGGA